MLAASFNNLVSVYLILQNRFHLVGQARERCITLPLGTFRLLILNKDSLLGRVVLRLPAVSSVCKAPGSRGIRVPGPTLTP